MKLIKIINLFQNLNKINDKLEGREVNYAIEKNLSKLQIEIDVLSKEEKKISNIVSDYNNELEILRNEIATVNGTIKTKNVEKDGIIIQMYDFPENRIEELDNKSKELYEKHKDSIKKYETSYNEYQKMLEEKDVDFDIFYVKLHCVPDNISKSDMKLLFPIIKEKES